MSVAFIPWPGTELFARPDDDELTWQDKALCAEIDPEMFFPEKGGGTGLAKKICARCEVRAECLAFALANCATAEDPGWWGVWGGTSAQERQVMVGRRRKGIAA
jgi:WhiB family transcriptional regulator, redox-sensing transcriptional regulator